MPYTLQECSGGLEYLTLTFDRLKLSDYSRIVVRAYEAGTNIPLVDGDDNLFSRSSHQTQRLRKILLEKQIQINNTVFNVTTSGEKQIDLKILLNLQVRSMKIIISDLILNKVEGPYKNQEEKPFEVERLTNCVDGALQAKTITPRRLNCQQPRQEATLAVSIMQIQPTNM